MMANVFHMNASYVGYLEIREDDSDSSGHSAHVFKSILGKKFEGSS